MKNKIQSKSIVHMNAWRLHDYGGIGAMRLEEISRPTPKKGEVLVRLLAAATNPFDWYMAEGMIAKWEINLPITFGRDGAGIVEELGEGVTEFKVGEAVYGQADPAEDGTFAEYAVFRADRLMRKPESLSFAEASALPNTLYAAWNALFSTKTGMDLQPGQSVLIHGAGGGIGSLALQLAKWRGAHVIAVAAPKHENLLRDLGADQFIDYTHQHFEEEVIDRLDGVVDTICAEPASKSYSILKPGGMYVSLLRTPDQNEAKAKGVRAILTFGPDSYSATNEIEAAVAVGAVRPIVDKVYPLAQAPTALIELKTGNGIGKIVLKINESI
ncbi:NADP-dependent oxidoreductase [Paenibacillus peoriae]|uniref:NADP-dependent oxidoreductase n=1 Tax=Paenibacillus peoriae TaxID=59893 RepID=UPI00026C6077|nr:NADP-dependent oxidoreductase [Paenibacillus peoriae]MEC0184726.1 NADP-dependent oxidoreductase [Paenibacillus peoriae]